MVRATTFNPALERRAGGQGRIGVGTLEKILLQLTAIAITFSVGHGIITYLDKSARGEYASKEPAAIVQPLAEEMTAEQESFAISPMLANPTAAHYEQLLSESPELRAAIELIADKEGTRRKFNYIFTHQTFDDYSKHPNTVLCSYGYCSDAAGIGQFLSGTWNTISNKLELTGFTPREQLVGMVYLLDQKRGVLDEILEGDLRGALPAMSCEWAGLPPDNCGYGQYQPKNGSMEADVEELVNQYNQDYLPRARAGQDIVSTTLGGE